LAYEYDIPEPAKFTDTLIRFNGVDDAGHETFSISSDCMAQGFDFCKTAEKPYDIAVCACLIICKHWFPDIKVSSDGDMGDWEPAIDVVRTILGEEYVQDFSIDD